MELKFKELKGQALKEIGNIRNSDEWQSIENKYFSRKSGELAKLLKDLKDVSEDLRPKIGAVANDIKNEISQALEQKKSDLNLDVDQDLERDFIDVTLEIEKYKLGHLHPVTQVQTELEDIFKAMGFTVLDGPELESDYYNFEALNIPSWHPARDMQDTFYIDPKTVNGAENLVMRTQTSSVQVRAMQKHGAPLRVVIPGRCFRNEATDVRHEHTFYQLEGLMVDKDISFNDMCGVLETVAQKLYGEDTKIRLRPKYYPFVEPGVNGEVTCFLCHGKGCKLCKQTGWLEIFGAGMVHPNVLKFGKVDPNKYQGFAFGFGLTRLVMLKYNIDDVRLLQSGDLRFLNQF
jgi:phenylalanyl-tRNA synthetase alpha chain